MEVQDRISVPEEFLARLWEAGYFNSRPLLTREGVLINVLSLGRQNYDSGPDFKHIAIKIKDVIHQGDLEIHRSANDWYHHGHHKDSAYNSVVLHLIVEPESEGIAVRHSQEPVLAEVFVDISEEEIDRLRRHYLNDSAIILCPLHSVHEDRKISLIESAGKIRLKYKSERFTEEREQSSWNQIIYKGIMEALGYSKNQAPFRKLAQLLPFEAIVRELCRYPEPRLIEIQALFFGIAGLLPSQDPKLLLKDSEGKNYINQMEDAWQEIRFNIGVQPMSKEMWHFFRLRPNNFPTRRLAGASHLFSRFVNEGLLETFSRLCHTYRDAPEVLIRELEKLFICEAQDFWITHYLFDDNRRIKKVIPMLIGQSRAREIVINIILPALLGYAGERKNSNLAEIIMFVTTQYPKASSNQTIRYMTKHLVVEDPGGINTALKQQGLIHLYKMYCRKNECERCLDEMTIKQN